MDDTKSKNISVKAGAPQGSCLSPVLYLIFVNDLTDEIDSTTTSSGQYADDVGLYTTDRNMEVAKENMQRALDRVMAWCQKWQVIMNTKKSQVVIFSKCPTHKRDNVQLKMFGETLPTSNEASYLGVIFDSRLSWEHQISKITERVYPRLNLLRAMASLSKKHNPNLLSQLYNSTILSIFEYSSICIITAAESHLSKLQLIQNEALRIILKVPSYVPIERMNDCANEINVREHLHSTAKNRILALKEKSSLVQETITKFHSIKKSQFNTSPLDIIQL